MLPHQDGVKWCKYFECAPLTHRRTIIKPRIAAQETLRASVSFPSEVYAELERIAASKKVSIAWVVREAAERYVAEQWPLLPIKARIGE